MRCIPPRGPWASGGESAKPIFALVTTQVLVPLLREQLEVRYVRRRAGTSKARACLQWKRNVTLQNDCIFII